MWLNVCSSQALKTTVLNVIVILVLCIYIFSLLDPALDRLGVCCVFFCMVLHLYKSIKNMKTNKNQACALCLQFSTIVQILLRGGRYLGPPYYKWDFHILRQAPYIMFTFFLALKVGKRPLFLSTSLQRKVGLLPLHQQHVNRHAALFGTRRGAHAHCLDEISKRTPTNIFSFFFPSKSTH